MKIIDKKEFTQAALDRYVKAFLVYMISLSLNLMLIDLAKKAQIVLLIAKKVKIPTKYSNFLDVFLEEKALILLEKTE